MGKPVVSVAGHDKDAATGVMLLLEGLVEVPFWATSPLFGNGSLCGRRRRCDGVGLLEGTILGTTEVLVEQQSWHPVFFGASSSSSFDSVLQLSLWWWCSR
jgi:hypothetical protein